jgi:hypothetical protein
MAKKARDHMSSRSAQGAAVRYEERHPDEEIEHEPPHAPAEPDDGVPNRHSASAEAAALRMRERGESG